MLRWSIHFRTTWLARAHQTSQLNNALTPRVLRFIPSAWSTSATTALTACCVGTKPDRSCQSLVGRFEERTSSYLYVYSEKHLFLLDGASLFYSPSLVVSTFGIHCCCSNNFFVGIGIHPHSCVPRISQHPQKFQRIHNNINALIQQ